MNPKRCERTGKKKHQSQAAAFNAALNNSAIFGDTMRAYECKHCGCWHLTTQEKRSSGRAS